MRPDAKFAAVSGFATEEATVSNNTHPHSGVEIVELTGETLLLSVLKLLAALEKGGDNIGEELRKVVLKHARHHAEEQEAALAKARGAKLNAVERLGHHVVEVWREVLLADRLRERPDSVHRDPTELLFLTLAGKHEEVLKALHRWLEVWQELLLRCVGRAADGANDNRLDREGRSVEEDDQTFHDEVEVLVNDVVQDLEQRVEGSAGRALGDGVVDELHHSRDQERVLRSAFLLQPLAQTADGHTTSFPHGPVAILQTRLNDRPDLSHERSHELAATLNRDTECEHRTTALSRVGG